MTTPDGTAGAAYAPAVAVPEVVAAEPVVTEPGQPDVVVRVVRGDPDAEELAAVLAVLSASTGSASADAGAPPPSTAPQTWAAYWRGVRQPLQRGPDGWRASARPR